MKNPKAVCENSASCYHSFFEYFANLQYYLVERGAATNEEALLCKNYTHFDYDNFSASLNNSDNPIQVFSAASIKETSRKGYVFPRNVNIPPKLKLLRSISHLNFLPAFA